MTDGWGDYRELSSQQQQTNQSIPARMQCPVRENYWQPRKLSEISYIHEAWMFSWQYVG